MFEDEKFDNNKLSNSTEDNATTVLESQASNTTAGGSNSYSNYSYGQGSGQNTYGQYTGQNTTYSGQGSSQNTSYGAGQGSSQNTSYGAGQGSSQNTTYGAGQNSPYGQQMRQNSYGQGTTQTPFSSNYSYGQNRYNYGSNGQTNYGTYQYSTTANAAGSETAKPKKKKAGAIIAAILIVALITGGVGTGYYFWNRGIAADSQLALGQEDKSDAEVAEGSDTESASTTEEAKNSISATTVSGESLAVVTDVTSMVQEVMPSLVMIHNNYTASASYFGYVQQEEATASGSGIIVGQNDSELLVATNYHVIEGADTLEVIFDDGTTVEAVVKGTDSDMDLAVIAVVLDQIPQETRDIIKIATLGDSDSLTLGEPAVAIGNALGYGQSVTTGVISALNRSIEVEEGVSQSFIQTDAAINPGNSGGALLNINGEVIGINSNKIGGDTIEGMGYAIPISVAKPIIEKLMNEETKLRVSEDERGYIGISGVSVTSSVSAGYGIPQGVYVAEVSRGGGAEDAGIQKGDVITGFDGEEITSMEDLQNRLQYYAQGTTVPITVMRQNGSEYEEYTYDVTLSGASTTGNGGDSNAAEGEGGAGQYNGITPDGLPGDKNNGQGSGIGGH